MKLFVLALCVIMLQSCSQKKKCDCSLIYRDNSSNLFFDRETKLSFTGQCNEIYGNGNDKLLKEYMEGKKVSAQGWYETGENMFEEKYDQAGMFLSAKMLYQDGKVSNEAVYNSTNKNTTRTGYYNNGQMSYQETISNDTLTYKSFQQDGKPVVDKQAVIKMDWSTFLLPGQPLSSTDSSIIDTKNNTLTGFLTYYREYFKDGSPKFLFVFPEESITDLSYAVKYFSPKLATSRGDVPFIDIVEKAVNKIMPGSKAYFETGGKVMYERIDPVKCTLGDVLGILYNQEGNIFALQIRFETVRGSGTIRTFQIFDTDNDGNWKNAYLSVWYTGSDIPEWPITDLNQLCNRFR